MDAVLGQGFAASQRSPGHQNLEGVSEWSHEGQGACLEALVAGKLLQQRGGERGRAFVLRSSTLGCRGQVGQFFRLRYIIFCALAC